MVLPVYLNRRGDAGGRVAWPRVSVPPSRFERWMIRRKRASQHEQILQNFAEYTAVPNYSENLFFGLHLISGKKHFNFRRRLFLVFIQFRRRNYIISTEVLSKANAFGQGCKSVPQAKFYNLSTEYSTSKSNKTTSITIFSTHDFCCSSYT